MAAILYCAILNCAILDSAMLHKTLTQSNSIWLKLIHSNWTWWWQTSWIQPFAQKKLHSCILTQIDDSSHLEFCHVGFRHLVFFSEIHSKTFSLHSDSDSNWFNLINLMMATILNSAILNSAMLDSDTLFSSLRFTQKHSLSTLTLTQTNSIWLTRVWQPSWFLPS